MNYTSKFLEYEKNAQRLANLIDGHSAALNFFEKAQRLGRIPYNYSTIQNALKILLETQGISKTLPSLQSIAQQIQETQKIASPIPFIARLHTKIPQVELIFIEATKIPMSLKHSSPFMTSALSVATASINFSAELNNFPYPEQLKIVDALDSLNLDTNTDIEIYENLPEEIQTECISLDKFARNFWKNNREFILGILATVDTTVQSFSENDYSNIFTIILFTYYCAGFIFNQQKN